MAVAAKGELMILVSGASGLLGGAITRQLLAAGQSVRILTRGSEQNAALVAAGAEPSVGDLKDRGSLERAMEGVSSVITTANAAQRVGSGDGRDTFESVDLEGNRNLIDAASAARVRRFVFTSASMADAGSPDPFMSYKGRTEQTLVASGMDYTILAPHVFMEVWFGMVIGTALQSGEPVTLVQPGDKRHSFVSVQDVAAVAVAALGNPAASRQRLVIGGPEALTWAQVVQVVGRVLALELPVKYVPIGGPLPYPEATWGLMYAMETFEAVIPSEFVAATFGVKLTPAASVAARMFGAAGSSTGSETV